MLVTCHSSLVTALMQFNCWKCGTAIQVSAGTKVGKREACPKCDADLHSCRNCQFYDPGKHNQCAEPQAEWVRYKEEANYCDYFQPNPVLSASRGPSPSQDTKKKFDSLFKA
ncbi:MAG TPA: hypothetical protein VM182_01505 [Terriglobia bacterium]|nr:hypothetical protein [Terriglobia bacterium]